MTNRKAFTLVELLVVIGIILILMGLLLPAISQMHRSAQITGQKADFQTIAAALEQYRQDFGDYPRNDVLPRWNTNSSPNYSTPAPIHLSLAAALLGSGPMVTQEPGATATNIGQYEIGDGADGLGFRAQTTNYTTSIGIAPPSELTTPPYLLTAGAPQTGNFIPDTYPNPTYGTVTISVGTPYEETVGFTLDPINHPGQLVLTAQPVFPTLHQPKDTCLIKIPTGKITQNYISPDTFKVAIVPLYDVNNLPLGGPPGSSASTPPALNLGPAGEQVLLDRWGQVIQYFPRYGPANNRLNDSSLYTKYTTPTAVQAGPLYGESQPASIDPNPAPAGENAIYDFRDGAPYFTIAGPTAPAQTWPVPPLTPMTVSAAYPIRFDWTIQWMLGDQPNSAGVFEDAIMAPEVLRNDGPYILISAGPDGPNRLNGGYCNFANPATGTLTDPTSGNILTPAQLLQMFLASGNVYNFDHP